MKAYDLVVIGGGPGGYSAAVRAAQLGLKVCLYEPEKLGGTCLNRGCIPTKALYRSAEIFTEAKNAEDYGVECTGVTLDYHRVLARKDEIVSRLVTGIDQLLSSNGIKLVQERVTVNEALKQADNVIIATGAKTADLSVTGIDLPGVIDSEELLAMKKIPDRLTVIGGGVVGIEFASIFTAFGSEVTVLEYMPEILPNVDKEIRKRFLPMLKKQNIKIMTSCRVKEITTGNPEKNGNGILYIRAEITKRKINAETDTILVAAGRKPYVDSLSLDETDIENDRDGIRTDSNCETKVKGVYAVGDVAGGMMLAHVAAEEGIRTAEHIATNNKFEGSKNLENTDKVIPGCIFTFPEIAYAGMTEDALKDQGAKYRTGKFMFGANGKALCIGDGRGLVKVLTDSKGILLGVHILGPHASDLIHEGVLAIEQKLGAEDLARIIHAHPTLSEAFHEAVLDAEGKAIHKIL